MNDLSGERNVMLGCLAMGMTREEVRERYQDIIDFSGINERGDFISLPMRTYSSGMAARLRFSIAAAKNHDVLLIDEALATGDTKFRSAASSGSASCARRPARSSWSATTTSRSGTPASAVALAGVGRAADGRPDRRGDQGVREVHRQVGRATL